VKGKHSFACVAYVRVARAAGSLIKAFLSSFSLPMFHTAAAVRDLN
jgi:hypothetical protein